MTSRLRSTVPTVVLASGLIAAAALPSAQTPVPIVAQNPAGQTAPPPAAQAPVLTPMPDAAAPVVTAPPVRKIQITFNTNGTVTLIAQNASARDILNEWARIGGSRFVNVEQMRGGPIPVLEFDNQPETVVLDSLLRSTAGYILGPKLAGAPGPSQFGAVYIVAQSTGVKPAFSNASPVAAPMMSQPDDEIPPVSQPQLNQPAATTPAPATAAPKQPGVFVPIVGAPPPPGGTGSGARGGGSR
jgi:hypothetical protein